MYAFCIIYMYLSMCQNLYRTVLFSLFYTLLPMLSSLSPVTCKLMCKSVYIAKFSLDCCRLAYCSEIYGSKMKFIQPFS